MNIERGPHLDIGPADWREEMWIEIYDRAKKRRKIRTAQIGNWQFDYAIINPEDGYGRNKKSSSGDPHKYGADTTFWIKDAEKEGEIGLNEGELAFVLERKTPPEFQDLVGLHEFIEAKIGPDRHAEACLVELTELFKMDQEFIERYAQWLYSKHEEAIKKKDVKKLHQGYFGRALPDFVEYLVETDDAPAEVLKKFRLKLEEYLQKPDEQPVIEQIKQKIEEILKE